MQKGAIKGWDFSRYYSADGTQQSTLDALNADKKKLEARLLQIPKQISALERSIASMQSDYDWLSSLSKRRQKQYEKDKGVHPHVVSAKLKTKIGDAKATISSLKTEKSRIPGRIEAIQKQLDTLVKGESDGLSKGLDKESAKALGEIELEKEKARLEHESQLQQIEADKAQRLAEEELAQQEQEKKGNNTALFIGIGVVAIIIIVGIVLYRRSLAKAKVKVQPLKT